ncbi:MAG: hypothetical protein R2825_18725 [Saprospiraceae bacterium]
MLTREVIQQFPLILHEGVPSTAKTKYYGTQQIITDSIGRSNMCCTTRPVGRASPFLD